MAIIVVITLGDDQFSPITYASLVSKQIVLTKSLLIFFLRQLRKSFYINFRSIFPPENFLQFFCVLLSFVDLEELRKSNDERTEEDQDKDLKRRERKKTGSYNSRKRKQEGKNRKKEFLL